MYSRRKNGVTPPKKLKKSHIEELHYICPIENLESILTDGILSHKRVSKRRQCRDVSNSEVQERRSVVMVKRADEEKGFLALHRHANFYLNGHNAMMYNLAKQQGNPCFVGHESLCVLRIRREILDRGDAMLSSRNSSTDAVTFFKSTENPLYAEESSAYLTRSRVEGYKKEGNQIRQAEVLFPYEVHPSYIGGIFVSCDQSKENVEVVLRKKDSSLPIKVHPSLFFQGSNLFISLEAFNPLPLLSAQEREALYQDLPDSSDSESEDDSMASHNKKFTQHK